MALLFYLFYLFFFFHFILFSSICIVFVHFIILFYCYINQQIIKYIVPLAFILMFYLTPPIYPFGTPEAGSGLSTIVFYDLHNVVIRRCL